MVERTRKSGKSAAERQKEYRERNKQKILEQQKQYYEQNRERVLKRQREYYERNRAKIIQQQREWRSIPVSEKRRLIEEKYAKQVIEINPITV